MQVFLWRNLLSLFLWGWLFLDIFCRSVVSFLQLLLRFILDSLFFIEVKCLNNICEFLYDISNLRSIVRIFTQHLSQQRFREAFDLVVPDSIFLRNDRIKHFLVLLTSKIRYAVYQLIKNDA